MAIEGDAGAFRQAMAPTVDVLRVFTTAVHDVGPRHGDIASVPSRAIEEIAVEDGWTKCSKWDKPLTTTHSMGEATLRAAADYARTFAEAFTADEPPIYGHLVVARGALEACVITSWLSEPGIDPAERIKRGLCEQLYSASEVQRLNLPRAAKRGVDQWKADAASFGWDVKDHNDRLWTGRGKPIVGGASRPSVGDGITRLLVDNHEAQIGRLLWSSLSAVSHVTWWGLVRAFQSPTGTPDAHGMVKVPVGTTLSQVSTQAFCVLRALRNAATSRFTLMGWSDAEWQAASQRAEGHEFELFKRSQP